MAVIPTYPGVYIEEIPSGVRTITGVATSITAFIGRALRGPVNEPTRIQSFGDYERTFGGLWLHSTMSYAIRQFFQNGGADALVVRLVNTESTAATVALPAADETLNLTAAPEGAQGNRLRVRVEVPGPGPDLILTVQEIDDPNSTTPVVLNEATYEAATPTPAELETALNADTSMVAVDGTFPTSLPDTTDDWIFLSGGEGPAAETQVLLPVAGDILELRAVTAGVAGNNLRATVVHSATDADRFALIIERAEVDGSFTNVETFANLQSIDNAAPDFVTTVVNASTNVNVNGTAPNTRPAALTRIAFADGADAEGANPAVAATANLEIEALTLQASNPGVWGNRLRATVDFDTADPGDSSIFNLTIEERDADDAVVSQEVFRNVSLDTESARYLEKILEIESTFVDVPGALPTAALLASSQPFSGGNDGIALTETDYQGSQADKEGIYALEDADLFNLLYLSPPTRTQEIGDAALTEALQYCQDRRAMLLIDPRASWNNTSDAESGVGALRSTLGAAASINAITYFPNLRMPDPLQENRTETFGPSGAVAGIISRTDATRGVWKAAAGIEASFSGVRELSYKLTDGENGRLNPLGLNALRTFAVYGHVVWGARTLAGDDRIASEWKYVPVRRTALFLEESLYRGLQWVVFEPNDESTWAQIRLNVGAFMQNLFRQGAFQGSSPREAYFVKCDSETTTQNHIDVGIVNILVGFAPLKPAEFVIIQLQQIAGQVAT